MSEEEMIVICPKPEDLSVISSKVQCEDCNETFKSASQLHMHKTRVHEGKNLRRTVKNKKYCCPEESCQYSVNSCKHFASMKYLKQHYLKVHAPRTEICDKCSKTFATAAMKNAHVKICGLSFPCQSCTRVFNSYESLLTHARRHSHQINLATKFKHEKASKAKDSKSPTCFVIYRPIHLTTIINNNNNNNNEPVTSDMSKVKEKTTTDIGIQTVDLTSEKKPSQESRQTQTTPVKDKLLKKPIATQTIEPFNVSPRNATPLPGRRRKTRSSGPRATKRKLPSDDLTLSANFSPENLFPSSPLPLRHEIGLQDYWEEKSTSGTQTTPEKQLFGSLSIGENFTFGENSNGVSRSDPMLNEESYTNKFSSIETQTDHVSSLFNDDSLSNVRSFAIGTNIETQTTDEYDKIDQLLYSNTWTQTCEDFLSSDLELSNIQTQTPWPDFEDSTVSTETQTKCHDTCGLSMASCARTWLNTQTSHMETQTDLFNMFEELE